MTKKSPEFKYNKLSRVYIASPYSYYSKVPIIGKYISKFFRSKRERAVSKITAALLESPIGPFAPIGPITQSHRLAKFMTNVNTGFDTWRDIDFTLIEICDIMFVIMLDGWEESQGVQAEIAFAVKKDIPRVYINKDMQITKRSH